MGPIAHAKCVKVCDPRLRKFSSDSTRGRRMRHIRQFCRDNFQPETGVVRNVTFGMAVEQVGIDIPVQFDDSRT